MRSIETRSRLTVLADNTDRASLPRSEEAWNFHAAREHFEAIGLEPVDCDRAGFMSDDDFLAEYTAIDDDNGYIIVGKVWRFCALRESAVDALRRRGRAEFYLAANFGEEGLRQPGMHSPEYDEIQRLRYEELSPGAELIPAAWPPAVQCQMPEFGS